MFIAIIIEKITLYLGSLKTIFNSIQNDKTLISKKSYSLLSSSATISRLLNCSWKFILDSSSPCKQLETSLLTHLNSLSSIKISSTCFFIFLHVLPDICKVSYKH